MSEKKMRNVGIFAHVDAGKTTTTEHILYESGRIRTLGSVDSGTSQTDSLDIERERGISVKAATTSFLWQGVYVNLVDTPGHVDFLSEVERSLRVMDGAVLVISAVEGVQSQTEIIWQALQTLRIPTLLYINKMDRIGADFEQTLDDIAKLLTPFVIPIQIPSGEAEFFLGSTSIWQDSELTSMLEKLADLDDGLMMKFIEGAKVSAGELKENLKQQVLAGQVFPVLFGVSSRGLGITDLMDAIIEYLPAPLGDAEQPLAAVIFKIERDKVMGKLAFARVYQGTIRNRDIVINHTQGMEEKITQIRKIDGRKVEDLGVVYAGDIAALCGLAQAQIGDVLGDPAQIPVLPRMAVPLLNVQVFSKSEQHTALVAALQELTEEDPLLDLQWLQDERELHLKVMGSIQLEILTSLLKTRFNLQATFGPPSVIYKETPSQVGEGFIAYTMPKPCWAILRFLIEPGPLGSGIQFHSQVRAESLLIRYQNEVERRVPEALQQGLYGWEVTDVVITLVEGEHHVWHTHPLDFAVATPMGLMDGLQKTGTTLLEPLLRFRITAPEEFSGKIMSDLVQMRASFEPPVTVKGRVSLEGILPVATSLEYPIKLSSITGGRGTITTFYVGYQPSPPDVQASRTRRGVNPLDQSKFILAARKALL
ncbi:TetM/TetW/TetO/TetS family tetracycline resistance ribosomal protection protein [Paenibacillus psychroresistens]|uniref:TetM/TetW/TetO/TetS family tetracycline resistance ribosomal protection protein n=1 Tax=Paenibacillus psychroresistens TaxID=1778678 RepID=A0A6B8RV72_9BACL|nr:TetM/TetW/TetO/TetS family tetracycline resistance ribosomal protection protein [Paenibacillus psychroresistens]QGQ99525.1 TetM/TetW/TetO/TetS family tetracycline resistance ribosomal protection protein [Paenibacillus psychroresistens]